mmetsp:Transcript_48081/g.55387  ORF Transcript_48081/g.55387 Transcript_48081/m.55387 type:complete len:94 (-) Transcript_48081:93-374(-)
MMPLTPSENTGMKTAMLNIRYSTTIVYISPDSCGENSLRRILKLLPAKCGGTIIRLNLDFCSDLLAPRWAPLPLEKRALKLARADNKDEIVVV